MVRILTAKNAARLRLRGTLLVVLSACETAVGTVTISEGAVGLLRSLKLAGARSELCAKRRSAFPAKALDPYFWAPFVPYGDGGLVPAGNAERAAEWIFSSGHFD